MFVGPISGLQAIWTWISTWLQPEEGRFGQLKYSTKKSIYVISAPALALIFLKDKNKKNKTK